MNELSTDTQPARDSETYQLTEKLLRPRFQILDALALAASLNPNGKKAAEDHKRKKDEARGELMALPINELRSRVQQQEAQAAADRVTRAESEKKRGENNGVFRPLTRPHGVENRENTYCPGCHALLIERIGFQVRHNRLNEGRCPDCARVIPGFWSIPTA